MSAERREVTVLNFETLVGEVFARVPNGRELRQSQPSAELLHSAPPATVPNTTADLQVVSMPDTPKGRASRPPKPDVQRPPNRELRRRLGIDLSQPGLLRLADVLAIYRVSRSTWYAGIQSGLYEPGIPIGPRCVAWRSEYVRELIANPPKFVRG